MKSFYGLQWYLALTHAQHGPLLGGGMAVLVLAVLGRWVWRRWYPSGRRRHLGRPGLQSLGAPLVCIVLGVSLLCLPGWRGLDGVLNDADLALLAGFFQVRTAVLGGPPRPAALRGEAGGYPVGELPRRPACAGPEQDTPRLATPTLQKGQDAVTSRGTRGDNGEQQCNF